MAAPLPHVLTVCLDAVSTSLAGMSKGAGYRRDYKGVKRFAYDLPLEDDDAIPWVQMDIGDDEPERPEHSSAMHQVQEVFVQVHVKADKLSDGSSDIMTPVLEVAADIHQAVFANRSCGVSYAHIRQPTRREVRPFGATLDAIGATLRVTYELEYFHRSEDMSLGSV